MEVEKDSTAERKAIGVGPWGGNGGTSWDDGWFDGIREITLVHARCIDSMLVVYEKNGRPVAGEKHGGSGGTRTSQIKLQWPDEIITCISGQYSPVVHGGGSVIRSLSFKTNRRTFGPFGTEEGTPFCIPIDGGHIVGFKGKSGWYLDSIGFYITKVKGPNRIQIVQQKLRRIASVGAIAKS